MDKQLYTLLKTISNYDHITLSELFKFTKINCNKISDNLDWLLSHNYVSIEPNIFSSSSKSKEDELYLTTDGRLALKNYQTIKRNNFLKEFRNWCSFFIALAAFIKSFFF